MSLINCPECNSLISINATSCPKCGYNMIGFDFYKKPDSEGYVLKRYLGFDREVKIPNVVTTIAADAFNDRTSLISVTLLEGLELIENSAFKNCTSLTNINLPKSLKKIGNYAFYECSSLRKIEIPNSVTKIGIGAFSGCSSLTSIKIPESVTSIEEEAFSGCSSLTNIIIPNSVTKIGIGAFSGCSSLTSIKIPGSVTSIGEEAFSGCSSLTSINIPESITSIGEEAFYRCESLKSIKIPESVTSIGDLAFDGCSSLTSIKIPKSVTSIGESAFSSCSSLTSINIPESVTSIGVLAFNECESLTSINIPESVTSIGDYTFFKCSSLTSITIPKSVARIGDKAFYKCSSLKSITISSATKLGADVFLYCSSLADLYFVGTKSQISYLTHYLGGFFDTQKDLISIAKNDSYDNHELSINVHFKDKYDNDVANMEVEKKNCNSTKQQKTELTLSDLSKKEYTIIIPEGKKELTEKLFHSLNKQKKLYVKNLIIPNSIKKISINFLLDGLTDYNLDKYEFTQEEKELFADYFDNDSDPDFLCIIIDNIYFNGSIDEWKSLDNANWDDDGWFFNLYTKDPKGDVILDGNRYVHFKDNDDNDVANMEVEKKNCNSTKQQKTELTLSDLSKKEYTIIIPEGKKELTEKLFHSLNKQKKLYVKNLIIPNSIKKISINFLLDGLTDYNLDKYEFTQEEKELFADYFDNDSDPDFLCIIIDNIYFNGSIDEWKSLDNANWDDDGWFFNLYTKDPKGDVILDGNRYKKHNII